MDVFAWSILELSDSVGLNLKVESVEDRLTFTEAVVQNLNTQGLSTPLRFVQLATPTKNVSLSVAQSLVFVETVLPKVYVLSVEQFLFVWNEAISQDKWPLASQTLALSQSATVASAKGATSSLVLAQSIGLSYIRLFPVANSLALTSQTVGYLPSKYWTSFPITVEAP